MENKVDNLWNKIKENILPIATGAISSVGEWVQALMRGILVKQKKDNIQGNELKGENIKVSNIDTNEIKINSHDEKNNYDDRLHRERLQIVESELKMINFKPKEFLDINAQSFDQKPLKPKDSIYISDHVSIQFDSTDDNSLNGNKSEEKKKPPNKPRGQG